MWAVIAVSFGANRSRPMVLEFPKVVLEFPKKMLLLEFPKVNPVHRVSHTGWQQGGVPEEGENRRTLSRFDFSHAFQAPSMTAYLRYAVSATGPLCTHGKDKPGLGGP